MYVRSYFPKLEQAHKRFFKAQHELNTLIFKMSNAQIPSMDKFKKAVSHIGDQIRLMEEEIVNKGVISLCKLRRNLLK